VPSLAVLVAQWTVLLATGVLLPLSAVWWLCALLCSALLQLATMATGGAMLDFNQLLRESRRLESQMEGVTSSLRGRAGAAGGAAGFGFAAAAAEGAAMPVHAPRVPPLTRSLAQLDVASAKLVRAQGATVPTASTADSSQAQLLLAARGIDVRKQARALKELQQVAPRGAAAATGAGVAVAPAGPLPIDQFHPLDIEGFLHQQQQLLCHTAMEDAARVVSAHHLRQWHADVCFGVFACICVALRELFGPRLLIRVICGLFLRFAPHSLDELIAFVASWFADKRNVSSSRVALSGRRLGELQARLDGQSGFPRRQERHRTGGQRSRGCLAAAATIGAHA